MVSNSVISARLDIRCKAGDTFTRRFTFTTSSDPIDLSGHELKAQVKKTDGTVLIEWLNDGFALISTGIYEISRTADQMNLTPDNYTWDLQVTYPGGERRTWMFGDFEIYNQTTV